MTIQPIEFKGSAVLDATLEAAAGRDALLVVADSTLLDLGERIAGLALRHRLPTFSSIPEFTDAGVLVGYGPSRRDSYRRAATYVKKLLEGAKPAGIPVEQPTLIEMSINMQTARALGIVIPAAFLASAERVIEQGSRRQAGQYIVLIPPGQSSPIRYPTIRPWLAGIASCAGSQPPDSTFIEREPWDKFG